MYDSRMCKTEGEWSKAPALFSLALHSEMAADRSRPLVKLSSIFYFASSVRNTTIYKLTRQGCSKTRWNGYCSVHISVGFERLINCRGFKQEWFETYWQMASLRPFGQGCPFLVLLLVVSIKGELFA